MQALNLSAGHGWRWLSEGFALFRKSPLMLSLIVFSYWMMMAIVGSVPMLGQILVTLGIPIFSVSLMNTCRAIDRGETVKPFMLFSGFQGSLNTLFVLGAVYIALSAGILAVSALFDDGVLFRLIVQGQAPSEEARASGAYTVAAQVALALFVPLMLTYWYAPVLVAWHDLPAVKALFFSLVACLRNWSAFLVYGVCVLFFALFLPGLLLAMLLASLAGGAGMSATLLTFAVVLLVTPTLYASFYVSYRDVFVSADPNA